MPDTDGSGAGRAPTQNDASMSMPMSAPLAPSAITVNVWPFCTSWLRSMNDDVCPEPCISVHRDPAGASTFVAITLLGKYWYRQPSCTYTAVLPVVRVEHVVKYTGAVVLTSTTMKMSPPPLPLQMLGRPAVLWKWLSV